MLTKVFINPRKSKLMLLTLLTMLVVGARPAWAQKSLPYSYGFEEASCSTSGWTKVNCHSSSENYKINSDAYEGSYAFRFYYSDPSQYLISPELATSSYSISVSFWYKAHSSSWEESFKVGYSTTDTETSSFTFGDEVKTESTNWQEYTTTCPAGTKYICIANTSNAYFLYIDDLVVDSNSPYKTPKAFASTGVTAATATFGWTAGGNETAWQIAYSSTEGFDADAATKVDVTTNPYTLEGLTAETTYYARIRADYGSGNYSAWSDEVSFKPSNAITTTVNDGSSTSSRVPFNCNYADTKGTKSQFIIPASTLTSLQGRIIQDMTFYSTITTKDFGNARFDVYMVETSETTFDAAIFEWGDMDKVVASATVNIADGKMTITLDEGFHYSGDNLKIGFNLVATGSYQDGSWYGTSGNAIYNYSSTLNLDNFVPKITFTSLPGPAANKPRGLAVNYSSGVTAEVTWTGDADTYDIDVNGTVTEGVASPYTLENLTPVTTYTVKVRGRSGNDVSGWSGTVSFTTLEKYPIPTDVAAALTLGDGTIATLSWTENGTATQWQICLNDDEENLITTDENPFNLTGLTPETTYTAKVRAGEDDEWGNWSTAASFTPTNEYKWTVNDGTETNQYMPIYGYYVDNITKSQFVIPASSLTSIQGEKITRMTFYASQSSINWGSALFEVYMAEHDAATLSALADYAAMTKVMNAGSLEVSDGKMVVTLDVPYEYMGGNLLIGFLQTQTGSYIRSYWYGVTATGASFGGYRSNVSQQNFLPKTTFELANNVTLTLAVSAAKYGTFIAPFDVEVPAGVTASTISGTQEDGTTLVLTQVENNVIPANTPVILYSESEVSEQVSGIAIANQETYTVGLLTGVYAATAAPAGSYVLQNNNGKVGFYKVADGKQPTVGANRAYMNALDTGAQMRAFFFPSDDATGIATIAAMTEGEVEAIYTVGGAKVESLQKGLNILKLKNGQTRKVFVK